MILINLGEAPFGLQRGDRIAQLVISRVEPVEWEEIEEPAPSARAPAGAAGSDPQGFSRIDAPLPWSDPIG